MRFIQDKHLYLNDSDEQYTSVTTLIKKYEPEKDWDAIAEKYAKKVKKTKEQVQAEWKAAGKEATDKGTAFHDRMEKKYITAGTCTIEDEDCEVCGSPIIEGIKYAKPLKLEKGIYPELLIYSHKYKIAGQADLVEIVRGKINIKDYKTNKEIKKESFSNWKTGPEKMKYPLNNLQNCNFWHYCMQLNIYMYMLKAHNPKLKQGKMEILHVVNTDTEEIQVYQVPDLQKDVKRLLEHYYLHS